MAGHVTIGFLHQLALNYYSTCIMNALHIKDDVKPSISGQVFFSVTDHYIDTLGWQNRIRLARSTHTQSILG